jgi:hypothetical protein
MIQALTILLLSSVSFAHEVKILVNGYEKTIPVYNIEPRKMGADYSSYEIAEANTADFLKAQPFAQFLPEPFFYKGDLDAAKGDARSVFLIGGINCDKKIQSLASLTGLSLETLSLRARGREQYGSYANYTEQERPEWAGAGPTGLRTSSEGFISRKYLYKKGESAAHRDASKGAMRALLVTDNKAVRAMGLSHQDLARPLLEAIQSRMRENEVFDFNGERFIVEQKNMGGLARLKRIDFNASEEELRKSADLDRRLASGWTGIGTQGSFLNDELYSDSLYTLRRLKPKPGLPESITIDGLTPHLIYRYGFYQGGEYRTDPKSIRDFFGLARSEASVKEWKNCD